MYRVEIHREAKKEIENLSSDMKERIIQLLVYLQTTPYPFRDYDLKKLKGLPNVYRIRLGNYRVSYHIDDKEKLIIIIRSKKKGWCI